jgi:rSAM/selenodomain-associated transferase 1
MLRTTGRTQVILLTKAPRPGEVKTRLMPLLGAEGAAALQARFIKHALATIRRAGFKNIELHGDPASDPFLQFCADHYRATLLEQCPGDLGARMHHAFARAADGSSVVLIGSDCPALTSRHLREAARALASGSDAVLVPVEDGGYALIGLARADQRLFEGVAWGTSSVLEQTRERLRELGRRWTELETLWDVDTVADYERLVQSGLLDARSKTSKHGVRHSPALTDSL